MRILDDVLTIHGDWDEGDGCINITEALFSKDFGPWKAGEHVEVLNVDFIEGMMTQYDEGGTIIKRCSFKLTCA